MRTPVIETLPLTSVLHAPKPESNPRVEVTHGLSRVVEYEQFLDEDQTELLNYIKEENAYTDASFKELGVEALKQTIKAEMFSALTDEKSPEYVDGNWVYFKETKVDAIATVYYRYPLEGSVEDKEVYFDADAFTRGQNQSATVAQVSVSDDGTLLLFAYDLNGDEKYFLNIVEIATGKLIVQVENATVYAYGGSKAYFDLDNTGVYFLRSNGLERTAYLYYRPFSIEQCGWTGDETLILEEENISYSLSLSSLRDSRWLLLSSDSTTSNKSYLVDRLNPNNKARLVAPERSGVSTGLDLYDDKFWIFSNIQILSNGDVQGEGEYQLYSAPFSTEASQDLSDVSAWKKAIELPADYILEDGTFFALFTVFTIRVRGISRVAVAKRNQDGTHRTLKFLGDINGLNSQDLYENRSPNVNAILVKEVGVSPSRTFKATFDFNHAEPVITSYQLVHEVFVPGLDASTLGAKLLYATANDDTKIPVVFWYPKDKEVIGTMLLVYGAYGDQDVAEYVKSWQPLLDRGVACAIGYVRGGGELGQAWYHAGRVKNKMNTITDTIAVAKMLGVEGFGGVNKNNILLRGGSAGGIPVGGALNIAPESFAGFLGDVPFVDCLSTMLDPELPLTTLEYEEWGNPTENKEDYEVIASYAPVENIIDATEYPPVLAAAGLNDPRVLIQEPIRWILRLREKGIRRAFLKVATEGGHLISGDKEKYIDESAIFNAFIVWALTR